MGWVLRPPAAMAANCELTMGTFWPTMYSIFSPARPRILGWAMILVSESAAEDRGQGRGHGHLVVGQVAEVEPLDREIAVLVSSRPRD